MQMRRFTLLVLLVFGLAALATVAATPFVPPEKDAETIWMGAAPGHPAGVLVLRTRVEWDRVVGGLDPAYAGPLPNFGRKNVLLVVGRERENACRDTVLRQVTRHGIAATVVLDEKVPEAGCTCAQVVLPPKAWLVVVPRTVTKVKSSITDVVVPCREARVSARRANAKPVLLAQGSWDELPGARLLSTAAEVAETEKRLGQEIPVPNLARERLAVVTGRPRSNGCRQTRVVEASVDGPAARFVVEEIYPAKGQVCSQVYLMSAAFVYRVPATVEEVTVETRERRLDNGN